MRETTAAVLIMLLYTATICFTVYITKCGLWLLLLCVLDFEVSCKNDKEDKEE